MKVFIYIFISILLVSLQTSFLGELRPLGIIPNLVLLAVILNGLHATASSTMALALGCGMLLDLASGQDFGLRMAFLTLMALAVIVVRQLGFHMDGLGVVIALGAVGTLAYDIAILAGLGLGQLGGQISDAVQLIVAEIIVNSVLVAFAHLAIGLISGGTNRGEPGLRKRGIWQPR